MSLLEDNIYWMTYNISLAVIAIVCGWLALKVKRPVVRLPLLILWLLYIPNTLYLLSDSMHFSQQLSKIQDADKISLITQYIVLMLFGVISFVAGVYPIEKLIKKTPVLVKSMNHALIIVVLQFIIAFGIVMGRVERTHSWETFTNPIKVLNDALSVLASLELITFVIITGIVANIIYFSLKPILIHYVVRK